MTCGAGLASRGEQRKALLENRDDEIVAFMERGRSVAAIAQILGLAPDYCRKATRRLAEERGIDYRPKKEPPGALLTNASRGLRNHLANVLYGYRNAPGRHQVEVCSATGLTQAQQIHASERGGQHDFTISEMERLAVASDRDFRHMIVLGALKPMSEDPAVRKQEELLYQKVASCLNS